MHHDLIVIDAEGIIKNDRNSMRRALQRIVEYARILEEEEIKNLTRMNSAFGNNYR